MTLPRLKRKTWEKEEKKLLAEPPQGLWLNLALAAAAVGPSPHAGLPAASLGDVVRAWPRSWASPHGQGTCLLGPRPPSLQGAPELGALGDTK